MDYREEIQELRRLAWSTERKAEKVPMWQQAIELADLHSDEPLAYELRSDFMSDAGEGSATIAQTYVHFSWLLGHADKNPQATYVDDDLLLWWFKWVASQVSSFPQITLTQIEGLFADMTRRYQERGHSTRPVWKERCLQYQKMGLMEKAREAREQWLLSPQDSMNDCDACEQDDEISYALIDEQWDQARELATPILNGRMRCLSVPHATYASVLMLLLRRNEAEQAAIAHRKGYRLICRDSDFLSSIGCHLEFLALTGNERRGKELFARHAAWVLESEDPDSQFAFYADAAFLFRQLMKSSRTARTRMYLPREFPGWQESGTFDLGELHSALESAAMQLAVLFDSRNGTTRYMDYMGKQEALEELKRDWPLKVFRPT